MGVSVQIIYNLLDWRLCMCNKYRQLFYYSPKQEPKTKGHHPSAEKEKKTLPLRKYVRHFLFRLQNIDMMVAQFVKRTTQTCCGTFTIWDVCSTWCIHEKRFKMLFYAYSCRTKDFRRVKQWCVGNNSTINLCLCWRHKPSHQQPHNLCENNSFIRILSAGLHLSLRVIIILYFYNFVFGYWRVLFR